MIAAREANTPQITAVGRVSRHPGPKPRAAGFRRALVPIRIRRRHAGALSGPGARYTFGRETFQMTRHPRALDAATRRGRCRDVSRRFLAPILPRPAAGYRHGRPRQARAPWTGAHGWRPF
ncbi:hypothetical protein MTO96_013168 [Rhipicephalus appendiculatus]